MKFIFQMLATVALVALGTSADTDVVPGSFIVGDFYGNGKVLGELVGGERYTDIDVVTPGQKTKSIHIRAGRRVNGVGIDISDGSGVITKLYHGGDGGNPIELELDDDEYITAMEVHTGNRGAKTRAVFIQFTTNKGRTVEGGSRTDKIDKVEAPVGFQLGGFQGSSDKELDSVGPIWTWINATEGSSSS